MSPEVDRFLGIHEKSLTLARETVSRAGWHVDQMPPGPARDRAELIQALTREYATDLDAALQRWEDVDRQQAEYDADQADEGAWGEPTWDEIYGEGRE